MVKKGRIVGGVIGTEVIRFDIYGSDVVLANKMESNGEKDRVNVSETTKNILSDNYKDFKFDFNQVVRYGKKEMNSYFVQHKTSSNK